MVESVLMSFLLLLIPAGWIYLFIIALLPKRNDDDRQD